jgi:peroxin-19
VIQQDGIPAQNQDQEPSDMESTEFRVQLEEQMAALMGGSDETPEMKREIEAALQELGSQLDSGESGWGGKDAKVSNPPSTEKPFQEKIRRTIERMQVSEEQGASASVSDDPDNIIAQLLQEIQGGSFEGGGNEEEFSNMLTNMMEQLTNRDILFEPMKELHEKFPTWMTQNKHRTNEHDLRRYEDQQRLVGEIVGKFNEKEYSDTNPADREYIVERMQQVRRRLS